jgi:hypothetical protein
VMTSGICWYRHNLPVVGDPYVPRRVDHYSSVTGQTISGIPRSQGH